MACTERAVRRSGATISIGLPILLLLTFLAIASAHAADATNPFWIQTGGFTYHFNTDEPRNGNNWGLGVEYGNHPTHAFMGGVFRNSYDRTAVYAAYAWTPWKVGPLRAGLAAGLASGYPTESVHGVRIGILPSATWESRYFGINVGVLPTRSGMASVQFKFRF